MNGKLAVGIAVLLVAGVAVAGAVVTGFGPAPGGDTGTPAPTPESTGTVYDSSGSDSSSTDDTATSGPLFSFSIDNIDKCGQTCRDVTATLSNEQDTAASNVTVYTSIYAGNSTDSSDRVWSGTEDVGNMEAGGTHTSTNRIELSFAEANQIQNNDGWITVVTTVESAEQTVTFKDRRQVA